MKFRWRGGARGYFVRNWVRARRREYYRGGGRLEPLPLPILILLAIVALGGFPAALGLIILFAIILQALLPLLIIIGLVGTGFFVAQKGSYIQALSRLFLKEGEGDDMVLSYREIGIRAFETISQASRVEKAILASLAIITVVVYAVLLVAIAVRLAP